MTVADIHQQSVASIKLDHKIVICFDIFSSRLILAPLPGPASRRRWTSATGRGRPRHFAIHGTWENWWSGAGRPTGPRFGKCSAGSVRGESTRLPQTIIVGTILRRRLQYQTRSAGSVRYCMEHPVRIDTVQYRLDCAIKTHADCSLYAIHTHQFEFTGHGPKHGNDETYLL